MILAAHPVPVRPDLSTLSPQLRDLLATVHRALPDAYLVGGGVRDLLRGRQPSDLDFISTADLHGSAEALAAELGGHIFPLDAGRGQYRVVLEDGPVTSIDLSPYAGDLQADLRRRDFTVDAMAALVEADGTLGELIDPLDGASDLEAQMLRMVSEHALTDDPLRLLRAVRLATEMEFIIEPATADAIGAHAGELHVAAPERQREELTRLLATPHSAAGVRLMDELGLLAQLLPELMPAHGVEQPGDAHYYDVFDHSIETLATLDALLAPDDAPLSRDRTWMRDDFLHALSPFGIEAYLSAEAGGGHSRAVLLKLAGLLHDVSKPETKALAADGRTRFLGHPELGANKAAKICERLRFGNKETRFVSLLVEEHLRPTQLSNSGPPSERALYRFFRDLGDAAPALLTLTLADGAAAAGPRLTREGWRRRVAYMAYLLDRGQTHAVAAKQPRLLTGDDLIEILGMTPGPELGRVLSAVEEAIGAGEVVSRQAALAYARQLSEAASEEVHDTSRANVSEPTSPPRSPSPTSGRGMAQEGERRRLAPTALWDRVKAAARQMRHAPTAAERALWEALRNSQLEGFRFRRQHAVGPYIADFYCAQARLVVEVDGPSHDLTRDEDGLRSEYFNALGIGTLRFDNQQVLSDIQAVLSAIRKHLPTTPSPSSKSERGTEGVR
jgi:poly(A) polymerase